MDNYSIAKQFSMLSKLMEVHAENAFKAKSYSIAAYNIERIPVDISSLSKEEIFEQKGIGASIGKGIIEILETGKLKALEEYIEKTPPGVLEIMQIKGIGPKKVNLIWKEMEIETPGELLYACTENRLARFKGFGEKTQKNIEEAILFLMKSKGRMLYAEAEPLFNRMQDLFIKLFAGERFSITGEFRRQLPVIETLDWVTTATVEEVEKKLSEEKFDIHEKGAGFIFLKEENNMMNRFFSVAQENFYEKLFQTSASEEFISEWNSKKLQAIPSPVSEEEIFQTAGLPFVPPPLRENFAVIKNLPDWNAIIKPENIKGIIHSHSTWSDGSHSIEKMAKAAIDMGFEYLVISDHSKSAFYANGLKEEQILSQHAEIDELNKKLAPFKIFKSIESDILYDGSLDYTDDVLAGFDLVIASVHSILKMTEEKAMMRLLAAIENPYTSILGHMTGRLLLSRPGYPVNHEQIIDACIKNNVVIELNANPRRLDIDWQYIRPAIEKGAMISINPDAHEVEEFEYVKYGVLVAQKAGLTPLHNLSSLGLMEFENFITNQKLMRTKGNLT